jgi:protein TonB
MFKKPEYEREAAVQIKIPWDSNTARGFGVSLTIILLFLLIAPVMRLTPPVDRELSTNSVPLMLLNFGEGDGTGRSKGNLTKEGASIKGPQSSSPLEDANLRGKTKFDPKASQEMDYSTGTPKPVDNLSSTSKNKNESVTGTGTKDIGNANGVTDGQGLGSRGSGKGKGYGFGDIEWGGGGNRIVLNKPLPKFPSGVNYNAELKFRFTVLPDGTVGRILPLQKGDPKLEAAALEALRQWRFNALKQDIVMEGTIPLTFVLR